MSAAAQSFWWPKITKDIQAKCDECIPCRMTGKSIKPQIPMTEINYLPPVEKPNQEIQLIQFNFKPVEMKQNKNKFESKYETKPQTAVAGTKQTITTDTNKTIHRKLISKPLPNTFQNPLSRRGENRRGPDGRFATQTETSETTTVEEEEKESDSGEDQTRSQAADVSMESVEANFEFTSPKQLGRGRKKPSPSTPGRSNLRLHVDVLTEEQLEQAMQTINENPTTTTIVDNTGNQ